MSHELQAPLDSLLLSDSHDRPLAKLQGDGPFLMVAAGPHVLDAQSGTLTLDDVRAIRDWCDRRLGAADGFEVVAREHLDGWSLVELHERSDECRRLKSGDVVRVHAPFAPKEEA